MSVATEKAIAKREDEKAKARKAPAVAKAEEKKADAGSEPA
jgi:hypothetical protein